MVETFDEFVANAKKHPNVWIENTLIPGLKAKFINDPNNPLHNSVVYHDEFWMAEVKRSREALG